MPSIVRVCGEYSRSEFRALACSASGRDQVAVLDASHGPAVHYCGTLYFCTLLKAGMALLTGGRASVQRGSQTCRQMVIMESVCFRLLVYSKVCLRATGETLNTYPYATVWIASDGAFQPCWGCKYVSTHMHVTTHMAEPQQSSTLAAESVLGNKGRV